MWHACLLVASVLQASGTSNSICSSGQVCPEQNVEAVGEDISSLLQTVSSVKKDKGKRGDVREKGPLAKEDMKVQSASPAMHDLQKESSKKRESATRESARSQHGSQSLLDAQRSPAQFHEFQSESEHTKRSEPIELTMARLANDVYYTDASGGDGQEDLSQYGWVRVNHYAQKSTTGIETDHVGMYRNTDDANPICVLAFGGSDSAFDFSSNTYVGSRSYCNAEKRFHQGFVNELENFRRERAYSDPTFDMTHAWGMIETRLNQSDCANQLWVTGHSLGGTMAEMFAYCVNSDPTYYMNVATPEVQRIFSYGAPGTSKDQLTNAKSEGGCFGGTRFYNMDGTWGDSVPGCTYPFDYIHAKYQAIRLKKYTSWSGKKTYSKEVKDCASDGARKDPHNYHIPSGSQHSLSEYIYRIGKVMR